MRSTGFPIRDMEFYGPESRIDDFAVPSLSESQKYCRSLALKHYENFTVVSLLFPQSVRREFYPIYAYCRWADDLADETSPDAALPLLNWWNTLLDDMYRGTELSHPVFLALRETVRKYSLPKELFQNLLTAFRQDQSTREYKTRSELLSYCRNSAVPVGRLILHLADCTDSESIQMSDSICTGLQLANFWQDVSRDWTEKGRIYIPQEDRNRFGLTSFPPPFSTPEFKALLQEEVSWAQNHLDAGTPLEDRVPQNFKRAIRVFRAGGNAILNAIRMQDYTVLERRPKIGKLRKLCILMK